MREGRLSWLGRGRCAPPAHSFLKADLVGWEGPALSEKGEGSPNHRNDEELGEMMLNVPKSAHQIWRCILLTIHQ